jgi:hypothetical protein
VRPLRLRGLKRYDDNRFTPTSSSESRLSTVEPPDRGQWSNLSLRIPSWCVDPCICLTSVNLASTWLNFEAGAHGKVVDDTRDVPLLYKDHATDVARPPRNTPWNVGLDKSGTSTAMVFVLPSTKLRASLPCRPLRRILAGSIKCLLL